jgi:hypothetical protein
MSTSYTLRGQGAGTAFSQVRFFGKRDGRIVAPQHAMLDAPIKVPPHFGREQEAGAVERVEKDAAGLRGAVGAGARLREVPAGSEARAHASEGQLWGAVTAGGILQRNRTSGLT